MVVNIYKFSAIVWVNQPEPKGFVHAVLIAKPFVVNDDIESMLYEDSVRNLWKIFRIRQRIK